MKNTPDLRIYVFWLTCFGSENPYVSPHVQAVWQMDFWHDAIMFERIPLPSETTLLLGAPMSEQTRHGAQDHATMGDNIFAGLERISILEPTSCKIVEVPI